PGWRSAAVRVGGAFTGLVAGAFGVWLPRHFGQGTATQTAMSLSRVKANFPLLWDTCLPWVLGYRVFAPGKNLYPDAWVPPAPVHWFQVLGAASLGAA